MSGGRFDKFRERAANTGRAVAGAVPGSGRPDDQASRDAPEIRAWVLETLRQIPMPDAPVGAPWILAPSALIAPHLPRPLTRIPGRLDRYGAVRLTPHEIGLDTPRPVPWSAVVEVRTIPLLDVLTIGTGGSIATLAARMLHTPKILDGAVRSIAEKAAEAVRSLLLIAAAEHAERVATVQIPTAVVYRAGRRGNATMTAGLFSSAVLALPPVTNSVLATASSNGVRIAGGPDPGPPGAMPPPRYQPLVARGGGSG